MTAIEPIEDRVRFRRKIEAMTADGSKALKDGGMALDHTLIKELDCPGTDLRCGVNLICRPSADVADYIRAIQNHLRESEPDQYYYPASDLHLTLLEITHDRNRQDANDLAKSITPRLQNILTAMPVPHLNSPVLGFDSRGAALNFLPTDGRLQKFRAGFTDRLKQLGVPVDSRYVAASAHLTLLRYLRPLNSDPNHWVEKLLSPPPVRELTWVPSSVWLSWGTNWYGMRSRINEAGPYTITEG